MEKITISSFLGVVPTQNLATSVQHSAATLAQQRKRKAERSDRMWKRERKSIVQELLDSEAGQVDATKDDAGQAAASQAAASQAAASHDEGSHDKASHDEASHGEASHDEASHDEASHGEASHGEASQDEASQDEASQDEASHDDGSQADFASPSEGPSNISASLLVDEMVLKPRLSEKATQVNFQEPFPVQMFHLLYAVL